MVIKKLHTKVILACVTIILSGCASMQFGDLFQGYNRQMQPVKQALRQGDISQAQSLMSVRSASHNAYVLNMLERARLQFLSSDWQESQRLFEQAYQHIEVQRNKAKIQISRGIEKLGAVVSNDNAISYQASYYEQSMLHTYQALNYAFQHDLEGALVEIRRANLVQENALKIHDKALIEAKSKLAASGIPSNGITQDYPDMSSSIGDIKNGFQNAFTFYLSGILYEANGDLNDAYIDYKRAIEIYPDNRFLQQDVLRLATQLDMQDDLHDFEARFGKYQVIDTENMGQVVFLFERGVISSKQDVGLNIPVRRHNGDLKFLSFSLPVYRETLVPYQPIAVKYDDRIIESKEIVRLQSLAAKDLEDNLPGLLTRQVVRVVAKEQMRQKLSREAGDVGNILASLYNIASEKADTRSWSTLPDEVDILPMHLKVGKQTVSVEVNGKTQMLELDIKVGKITLVHVAPLGNNSNFNVVTL